MTRKTTNKINKCGFSMFSTCTHNPSLRREGAK